MTDKPLAPPATYLPPPVRKPGRPRKSKQRLTGLSKRVRAAIDLMVFGPDNGPFAGIPLTRPQAAEAVGMGDHGLRQAFRNPHVRQAYNEALQVLREGARPRAIHQIAHLSEAAESEAVRLNASRHLDNGAGDDRPTVAVQVNVQQPGYVLAVDPRFAHLLPDKPVGPSD